MSRRAEQRDLVQRYVEEASGWVPTGQVAAELGLGRKEAMRALQSLEAVGMIRSDFSRDGRVWVAVVNPAAG